MKIECIKNKITDLVSKAERVTGRNPNLPVLSCLLLQVENGHLKVNATNLDIGISGSLLVRVFMEGRIAVPASILGGFLSQLPNEENVVFEVVEGNLLVSTKHSKTTIKSLNSNDFPSIPSVVDGVSVILQGSDFIHGLQSVWYGAATSSMKPELSSVYVYSDHKDIVFAATDSFRLAEKRIQVKKPIEFHPILIPFKNVADIIRIFEDYKGPLNLTISKNQISLSGNDLYIVSRAVEGSFPDYQQIIPKNFKTEVVLLKQDLVSALKISNIFSGSFHRVELKVLPAKKIFEVSSENNHVGKNTMKLESVVKGEELLNNFNHRYIMDCFQSIHSDSVSLGFNGAQKPLVVKGVGDQTFTYLVMPMNK